MQPKKFKIKSANIFEYFKKKALCFFKPNQNILIIGPPAAGKETQANRIAEEYCLCHLSTSNILRQEAGSGTETGDKIQKLMDKGEMVSDDVVLPLVKEAMEAPECSKGIIFDGFPRSISQSIKFDKILEQSDKKLNKVIYLEANSKILLDRVKGRLVHPKSGRVYHERLNPPKIPGLDNETKEKLVQRSDDNPELMKKRLDLFYKNNTHLLEKYAKKNLFIRIDATRGIEEIWKDIKNIL